jgi:uronate dehydrogenase
MRILLTGAAGAIGTFLRPVLLARYGTLRLFDRIAISDPNEGEEAVLGDIADLEQISRATEGIDCIVHFAGIPKEAPFEDILSANMVGTYNVFEAARLRGAGRVVFASSNHVIGFHKSDRDVGIDAELRPDSRYGVSKVFGEAVARLYADKHGIAAVCLRFGSVREQPEDRRQLATWMSHRDAAALVVSAIDTPDIRYAVAYGVSANTRNRWSNAGTLVRGFVPADNAETFAAQVLARVGPGDEIVRMFHGGSFAADEFSNQIDCVD